MDDSNKTLRSKRHGHGYIRMILMLAAFTLVIWTFWVSNTNPGNQFGELLNRINENDYAANHPKTMTLTQASVIKTFTPSPFMEDANDDQDNVNQQINLYLKSITNINDYQVQTTTTPGSFTKDYSATLTLNRK